MLDIKRIKAYHTPQRNFRTIRCAHPSLDLTVKLRSHLHGILILRCYSIVNVSAPQDEFHQIAD